MTSVPLYIAYQRVGAGNNVATVEALQDPDPFPPTVATTPITLYPVKEKLQTEETQRHIRCWL